MERLHQIPEPGKSTLPFLLLSIPHIPMAPGRYLLCVIPCISRSLLSRQHRRSSRWESRPSHLRQPPQAQIQQHCSHLLASKSSCGGGSWTLPLRYLELDPLHMKKVRSKSNAPCSSNSPIPNHCLLSYRPAPPNPRSCAAQRKSGRGLLRRL